MKMKRSICLLMMLVLCMSFCAACSASADKVVAVDGGKSSNGTVQVSGLVMPEQVFHKALFGLDSGLARTKATELREFVSENKNDMTITGCAVSEDEEYLIVCDNDGVLWKVEFTGSGSELTFVSIDEDQETADYDYLGL